MKDEDYVLMFAAKAMLCALREYRHEDDRLVLVALLAKSLDGEWQLSIPAAQAVGRRRYRRAVRRGVALGIMRQDWNNSSVPPDGAIAFTVFGAACTREIASESRTL